MERFRGGATNATIRCFMHLSRPQLGAPDECARVLDLPSAPDFVSIGMEGFGELTARYRLVAMNGDEAHYQFDSIA